MVPAGTKHNFTNEGPNPLVLYTVYGPPEHADGAVHKTKEEADRLEEAGKDEPPAVESDRDGTRRRNRPRPPSQPVPAPCRVESLEAEYPWRSRMSIDLPVWRSASANLPTRAMA